MGNSSGAKTGETVRDIVLGMSDGLTVPFALAAGLSGAHVSSKIVVVAGLAEVAAGAISMGLGGYLAGRSETESYQSEKRDEYHAIVTSPDEDYGMTPEEYGPVVEALRRRPHQWLEFMMKFQRGMDEPDPKRALISGLTVGGSYAVGGMVPLSPYFFIPEVRTALYVSIATTTLALFIFGYVKGVFTGVNALKSAVTTTVIGALASAAAFSIAFFIA